MNPNNRGAGTAPPPHPEFGGPTPPAPGEKRPVPPGAAVKEGFIVQRVQRNGRNFIRMRPQGG